MATQAERTAATRGKILASARTLFVTVGYEATTTSMILSASGVSRGAMYYHFDSKETIFEQLYVETNRELSANSVAPPADGRSARQRLLEHYLTWLANVSRPDVAAILLELGPTVLGWQRCRELEAAEGEAVGERLLREAVDSGDLDVASVELMDRMLRAAVSEAALALVHRDGQTPNTDDVRCTLEALLR